VRVKRRRARPRCPRETDAAISRRLTSDHAQRSPIELPVGPEYDAWIAALGYLSALGLPAIPPPHVTAALAATARYAHLVAHLETAA
jgi:hypothetical protein